MTRGQSRIVESAQAALAVLLVPALWPLTFVAVATFFPGVIDPLLGGAQNILYVPGLIWLIFVLLSTAGIAGLFRLKRTNLLLLLAAAGCALAVSVALSAYVAWGNYQPVGRKGVFTPDDFDVQEEIFDFLNVAGYLVATSVVTIGAFICVGGYRGWKSEA